MLENRASTPPNTPPNHDNDEEGMRRLLLLLVLVVGAKALHVVGVGLLLDVRHEAEEG